MDWKDLGQYTLEMTLENFDWKLKFLVRRFNQDRNIWLAWNDALKDDGVKTGNVTKLSVVPVHVGGGVEGYHIHAIIGRATKSKPRAEIWLSPAVTLRDGTVTKYEVYLGYGHDHDLSYAFGLCGFLLVLRDRTHMEQVPLPTANPSYIMREMARLIDGQSAESKTVGREGLSRLEAKILEAFNKLSHDYVKPTNELIAGEVGLNPRGECYTGTTISRHRVDMRKRNFAV